MGKPEGSLTEAQFEILKLLWDKAESSERQNLSGMTVAEIWESIRELRRVSRTTVLNLVDRLEKRGWLKREKIDGLFRYSPTVNRKQTEEKLATNFVGEFFDGSPSSLILILLGSKRLSKAEVQKLKALIDDETDPSSKTKRKG